MSSTTREQPSRLKVAGLGALGFVALLWVIEIVDALVNHRLDDLGIRPRSDEGLLGIVFAPLLHGGWVHLEANTLPALVLLFLGLALRLEVVDGALAATRLFGAALDTDVRSVDVALRPVFQAAAYAIFYGGLAFGVLACADFGPSLLAPGRIEHLLALPVRRPELIGGTFLGVLLLASCGALYGHTQVQ